MTSPTFQETAEQESAWTQALAQEGSAEFLNGLAAEALELAHERASAPHPSLDLHEAW